MRSNDRSIQDTSFLFVSLVHFRQHTPQWTNAILLQLKELYWDIECSINLYLINDERYQ